MGIPLGMLIVFLIDKNISNILKNVIKYEKIDIEKDTVYCYNKGKGGKGYGEI